MRGEFCEVTFMSEGVPDAEGIIRHDWNFSFTVRHCGIYRRQPGRYPGLEILLLIVDSSDS
jgi:hypothetical protein